VTQRQPLFTNSPTLRGIPLVIVYSRVNPPIVVCRTQEEEEEEEEEEIRRRRRKVYSKLTQ